MADLNRLICPRSIAVVGGGAWCEQVIRQTELMGFDGAIWPVHHKVAMVAGYGAFPRVQDLPEPPDAVFVGVNRHASVDIVEQLAQLGAGGAVCFASGFAEAAGEDASGSDLQARLVAAAGDMPILGPNCYGFINALDGALLWPDQHGCKRVDRGVAILTQSSNIAINLTMQQRALPIAYTVTCGNMAQTSQASIAQALLDDPRVTAIGLHIEGFGDLRAWEALARTAYDRGVPLLALKSGASDHAKSAAISHTASLAGSDAGAQALLSRLGIARVSGLPEFIETLKLLHCTGPLSGRQVASISCSGGEASLIADLAEETTLNFPPLTSAQTGSTARSARAHGRAQQPAGLSHIHLARRAGDDSCLGRNDRSGHRHDLFDRGLSNNGSHRLGLRHASGSVRPAADPCAFCRGGHFAGTDATRRSGQAYGGRGRSVHGPARSSCGNSCCKCDPSAP